MAWRNRCTPIPDSGFPNSEFRMAYGESGIPHHEVAGLGGAPGRAGQGPRAGEGGIGHGMYNANNGVRHSVSNGVPGHLVLNPDPRLWAKEGRGGTDTRNRH